MIGHDWGGGVAWAVAGFYPQRVSGSGGGELSATATGNRQALKRSPRQLKKSLHGVLPAAGDSGAHADFCRRITGDRPVTLVGGSYVRSAFDEVRDQDLPGRIQRTGRRLGRARLVPSCDASSTLGCEVESNAVTAPTLILWGERDRFLGVELVDDAALADVMSQGNRADVKKLPDAGHFVQNEAPDLFNELLLDWLSNQDASSSS